MKKLQEKGPSKEKLGRVLSSEQFKAKDDQATEMMKNADWDEWMKVL
ncbi:hypothetical protein [Chryseolinea lacunae]|uniref:DUF4351 domain-containing protein n=1 Tax=Chryseolinea lacunae TaxID=2801331 RepID=A0ABS1KPB4_9BACT|nr:hypothetical protein [Chryseolinea lacunae]MBL0741266.1 hypothetical protein [Chryseolinea lacunae]